MKIKKYQKPAGVLPAATETTNVYRPNTTSFKFNDLSDVSWIPNDGNPQVVPENDKYVREFFEQDILPRFKRTNPNATKQELNAVANAYSENIPQNIYYRNDGTGGFQSGGYSHKVNFFGIPINIKEKNTTNYNTKYKISRPVVVHENTHAYRQGILGNISGSDFQTKIEQDKFGNNFIGGGFKSYTGYSPKEIDYLNKAYNMSGYDFGEDTDFDHRSTIESGTTNTEVRYKIWKNLYDKLGRIPTIKEMDNWIDTMPDDFILDKIEHSNAYGHQSINNGAIDVNAIREALKNVASNQNNGKYINSVKYGGKLKWK